MFIKPTPFYNSYQANSVTSSQKTSGKSRSAEKENIADTITLSPAAQTMMAKSAGPSDALTSLLGTDGARLTPITTGIHALSLNQFVLLPNKENAARLTKEVSDKMPDFLKQNNISSAPSEITYDDKGEIKLPADYAEAEKFKTALKKEPALEYALKNLHSINDFLASAKELEPLHKELSSAQTEADMEAVAKKYAGLIEKHRSNSHSIPPSLYFSPKGVLSNPVA